MNLFSKKSRQVVGIDIGTHSVKLVELGGNKVNPKVISWGVAALPAGAFVDNAITNAQQISECLQSLLTQSNVKGEAVSVAISSSHAITKVLSMPADLSELEMEEQVSIEAVHFIPYPIDEVNIDFEILGESETNSEEVDVLLVACRRSVVDDYIDLVEDLGLELRHIDIDTYALERVYRSQASLFSGAEQPTALFDVGYSSSHLIVLGADRVIYSRHQGFGSAQLVRLIRKEYGLNVEEAEEILLSENPPSDFLSTVQEPFAGMLQQEINRALQFFYSSSSYSDIDRLILSGGCAQLNGLAGDLEVRMRTKVSQFDPIKSATVQTRQEALNTIKSSLGIAYGLALRGLE